MKWKRTTMRMLIAYWLLGLCNNYGYVIMLSAAEDIMNDQQNTQTSNYTAVCEPKLTSRHCSSTSTGAVLLADNLPALIVQSTFPFFMHRIPFGVRHAFVCSLQIACYFVVAFSQNVAMSLAGVTLASFGQGIGEITYLAMSSYFPAFVFLSVTSYVILGKVIWSAIAAWSSGTGGAGLIGSFAYAFLTDTAMADLSPQNALLCMLFIPVLFGVSYWLILDIPDTVYTPGLSPKTWIVPLEVYKKAESISGRSDSKESDRISTISEMTEKVKEEEKEEEKEEKIEKVPQRKLSFKDRLILIFPLCHLMIPLATVYLSEYLINQGLTELIIFNCHNGWNLTVASQYRWYQVLYQLGVFLSRSSVKFIELPIYIIYLLPIIQAANLVFFLFEAIYWFVPNIGIMFALVVLEGLLGGSAYVNTYNTIHKVIPADVREYSLSITTVGNSIGTAIAGFVAIPLHNFVCRKPVHHS